MKSEEKLFVVVYAEGLNIRSSGENLGSQNDLGSFDLNHGDVIRAVGVVDTKGAIYRKFDRIYRDGTAFDFPFNGFPNHQPSPTGEYWTAEKSGTTIYMKETDTAVSTPVSNFKYVGWRVLHKAEGGYANNPLTMPEVIPPLNSRAIEMTEAIQRMSFELMKRFNSAITPKLWSKVYHHDRAFTNFHGFAKKGDPRCNFIEGEDLGSPLPKYDKAQRLCGGQFVRGEVRGDKLVCVPGVHGIDSLKPLPSIDEIVQKNWYFFAITLNKVASSVSHFPQGMGGPVAIPFIFDREIEFNLNLFEKWEADELPDQLKMYK